MKNLLRVSLIFAFAMFFACETESEEDCPFHTLPAKKETLVVNEKRLNFANEFDLQINLLRKKLNAGLKPKSLIDFTMVVKKYEMEVLCPDSVFVSIYNINISNVCNHYHHYFTDKSIDNKKRLDDALSNLQEFVKKYSNLEEYREGYRYAQKLKEIIDEINLCKDKISVLRGKDPDLDIDLDVYEKKLKFIDIKIRGLKFDDEVSTDIKNAKYLYRSLIEIKSALNHY